jgi:hypothetical protein
VLSSIFSGLFSTTYATVTLSSFCITMAAALVLGAVISLVYTYKSEFTKSFAVTLALLPAVVSVVILMVSGSLGAGVAVAGTFSLVRFRSAPGTAKEICAIFLAMAVGLACGMGYPGFAALFTVIMCLVGFLYARLGFGGGKHADLRRTLRVTVPEDLNYTNAFDDLFQKYASGAKLVQMKTTNLGSLSRLTYDLTLRDAAGEKALIDELRCRNGNLEISSAPYTPVPYSEVL